jgi:hypothetical protein
MAFGSIASTAEAVFLVAQLLRLAALLGRSRMRLPVLLLMERMVKLPVSLAPGGPGVGRTLSEAGLYLCGVSV